MTEVITFNFYSDTNQSNALDELDMLGVEYLFNGVGFVQVSESDYRLLKDSIEAIVGDHGGELAV